MIANIIVNFILLIIMIYIHFDLEKNLRENYYKKSLPRNTLGTGEFFFIPLFFPNFYFRKEKISSGYLMYIFRTLIIFIIVYLIIQIIT